MKGMIHIYECLFQMVITLFLQYFFCFAIYMICIHSHALFAEKMGHSVVPCVPLRLWDRLPVRELHRPRLLLHSNNGQVMGGTGLVCYNLLTELKRLEFYSFICPLTLSLCVLIFNCFVIYFYFRRIDRWYTSSN